VVEPHHHDPVELGDLFLAQVVFGDRDIRLADGGAFPRGQAHVGPGVVGEGRDELGRRLADGGEARLFCMIWKNSRTPEPGQGGARHLARLPDPSPLGVMSRASAGWGAPMDGARV